MLFCFFFSRASWQMRKFFAASFAYYIYLPGCWVGIVWIADSYTVSVGTFADSQRTYRYNARTSPPPLSYPRCITRLKIPVLGCTL